MHVPWRLVNARFFLENTTDRALTGTDRGGGVSPHGNAQILEGNLDKLFAASAEAGKYMSFTPSGIGDQIPEVAGTGELNPSGPKLHWPLLYANMPNPPSPRASAESLRHPAQSPEQKKL